MYVFQLGTLAGTYDQGTDSIFSLHQQWDENAEKAFQTTKDKLTFEATMRCNNFPAHFSSAITEC